MVYNASFTPRGVYTSIKNVRFSTSHKKTPRLWNSGILAFIFLAHSFMNRFLWIRKNLIYISMTSKVIESHKSSSNFSFNPTIPLLDSPLMLPAPNFVDLSHSIFLTLHLLSSPLFTLLTLYLPLMLDANINLHTEKCFS